jgi:amino acid adenylation domain-containing protein
MNDETLHGLVATACRRFPGGPAILSDTEVMTYRELDRRTHRLARHLRAQGVHSGDIVALQLARCPDLIVTLLAVLRAGAAYLPIGVDEPGLRRARILREARPKAAIMHGATADRFTAVDGAVTIDLDRVDLSSPASADDDVALGPEAEMAPGDASGSPGSTLACVIYTSGTTGQPKGVMVEHGNLTAHLHWLRRHMPLQPGERLLQVTPYTLDASITDIFWPLSSGGTVVLLGEGDHVDAQAIASALVKHDVTAVRLAPPMLALLLQEPDFAHVERLRYLISGGDRLPAELARQVTALLPHVQVVNRYGPTEAGVAVTYRRFTDEPSLREVPLGTPIAGAELLLVTGDGIRPPEPGLAGELMIVGPMVARGYLAHQSSPARFRDLGDGRRGFLTGDRVSVDDAGELLFEDRVDDQVKVNGYRVELGEIEHNLRLHPSVVDCAAAVRAGPDGLPKVVAAIVPKAGDPPSVAALHEFLAERLLPHMIPAVIAMRERLPTKAGKVDRSALVELDPADRQVDATGASDDLLEVVRAVFAEILRAPDISADDNFFVRGGHSLLALRAIARIRSLVGDHIPARLIFDAQSPSALSQAISRLPEDRG